MPYEKFGEVLKALMQKEGLKISTLANKLGVVEKTIGCWRKGQNKPSNRNVLLQCIEPLKIAQHEDGLEICNQLLQAAGYQPLDDTEARKYCLQKPKIDWGEKPHVHNLYGRTLEFNQLTQWIVTDKCRFVTVFGMGGIGKTALVAKWAEKIVNEFQYVMWRSLSKSPPAEKILSEAITFFSNATIELPKTYDDLLTQLMNCLGKSRCLLVLDNAESIMQSGTGAGQGDEGYAELIKRVAESEHQSCLMLTSREKPKRILQEGENYPIQSLQLSGLDESAAQQFFTENEYFIFSEAEQKKIIQCYGGNPYALQVVLKDSKEWPKKDIFDWIKNLEESLLDFEDIEELLETQFERLSKPEKVVIYWLAINREPVSIAELKADIVSPKIRQKAPKIVKSLRRRSLIEKVVNGFTLQPVVMEYCTKRLIDKIVDHSRNQLAIFNRCALMKATTKDYLRYAQIRLILQPIWNSLVNKMGPIGAEDHLKRLLDKFQQESPQKPGYFAGNIINLLCQNHVDLTGYDFSHLKIWQADLRNLNLVDINFAHSEFQDSIFNSDGND